MLIQAGYVAFAVNTNERVLRQNPFNGLRQTLVALPISADLSYCFSFVSTWGVVCMLL